MFGRLKINDVGTQLLILVLVELCFSNGLDLLLAQKKYVVKYAERAHRMPLVEFNNMQIISQLLIPDEAQNDCARGLCTE